MRRVCVLVYYVGLYTLLSRDVFIVVPCMRVWSVCFWKRMVVNINTIHSVDGFIRPGIRV